MKTGTIVEFIDRQKVLAAVVTDLRNSRLRLLTENNRDVNLSENRLLHAGESMLDLDRGRDRLVESLQETAVHRRSLALLVNVKDLWEVLHSEQAWIDLLTLTQLCFPENFTPDHQSAVVRAMFDDRLYFKFGKGEFFPNSPAQVAQRIERERVAARREKLIADAVSWLQGVMVRKRPFGVHELTGDQIEYARVLKSLYLHEKESRFYDIGREILAGSGIRDVRSLFPILVTLGVFKENENVDLHRYEIPAAFPDTVDETARRLCAAGHRVSDGHRRIDLTDLPLMTIDGQATLDFDDALSIEETGNHLRLGIHIVDVGHFVKKGDRIDRSAMERGSSIYMPDSKIPMLPNILAEDLCSLRAGETRPAISTMAKMTTRGDVLEYEVFPSTIRVKDQLTYYDVNQSAADDQTLSILYDLGKMLRRQRISAGAVHISLPEVFLRVTEAGEIHVNQINRESPGRMFVSEIMILANTLMAKYLEGHGVSAVFRGQAKPRERLFREEGSSLFQNYMQRKLLSRFFLTPDPSRHDGLGVDAYLTATSPIRKYFDLVTQRQIRAVHGYEAPYSREEIESVIQTMDGPMGRVAKIQQRRLRYWLLKYLEGRVGQKEEAIVLYRKRDRYQVLIPAYMLECDVPVSGGANLRPEDLIQITIQRVRARENLFTAFIG